MAWLLSATLMLAPGPATAKWGTPSLPGTQMHAAMHEPQSWQRRGRILTRTVAISGTMTAAGALLMLLPLAVQWGDGTSMFPVVATGAALFTFGGAGTTLSAPFLGHHLRWDQPTELTRAMAHDAARRSRRHTRRLFQALGVEGGIVLAGGLSLGVGALASLQCADQDYRCQNQRFNAGAVPGFAMIGLGSLAMVSTGILIGLQKRHGHTVGTGPLLAGASPGSVTIRF